MNDYKPQNTSKTTLDPLELHNFNKLSSTWWDENGSMSMLHRLNPLRVRFINETLCQTLHLTNELDIPWPSLSLLDVGSGGGLVAEPYARLGANVTGIDPSEQLIKVAKAHAAAAQLNINYRQTTLHALLDEHPRFDIVLALEVIEHVTDPNQFLQQLKAVTKPGGTVFISTLNRTWLSYLGAIIGAEYVFRWLPVGTHRWQKFITPAELDGYCAHVDLRPIDCKGFKYNLLTKTWSISSAMPINYISGYTAI